MGMNKTLITLFTVIFCLTSSVGWSETLCGLIKREGLYYKKFSDIPFTGKLDCVNGSLINGKSEGYWVSYHDNGQLMYKGEYKNNKKVGYWVAYWDNGQLWYKGKFNKGKREGYWEHYLYDGELFYNGNFKNDKWFSD